MSSLWTPGGEVPIDREPSPSAAPGERPEPAERTDTVDGDDGDDADYARMAEQLLEAPAGDVVAQHAMGFYELAALHLSQPEPRLADARIAIDALAAVLDGLEGRLGSVEEPLAAALPQLRMAFVEATDRARTGTASG